jgi:hypothetical protein
MNLQKQVATKAKQSGGKSQWKRQNRCHPASVSFEFCQPDTRVLTITKKRGNLNICRCLATGPSFRSGQFFARTPQKQIVGAPLRMQANAARSPASGLLSGLIMSKTADV